MAQGADWVVDAEGLWRRETIPSMMRRLIGWDYKLCAIYQITVTLAERSADALGRLEVRLPSWRCVRDTKSNHRSASVALLLRIEAARNHTLSRTAGEDLL